MSDTAIAYAGSDPQQLGSITGAARAQRPRFQAHRHRLWLLDLHSQRHGHVLGLLRHLCRSAGGRRQAGLAGRDLFDLRNVCGRDRVPACIEFSPAGLPALPQKHATRPGSSLRWPSPASSVSASWRLKSMNSRPSWPAAPDRPAARFSRRSSPWSVCHGLHVSAGILWLLTMTAQVYAKGFRADIQRRILCFALFWHALDIIWVAVFTVVYLIGRCQMTHGPRRSLRSRRRRAGRRARGGWRRTAGCWAIWQDWSSPPC